MGLLFHFTPSASFTDQLLSRSPQIELFTSTTSSLDPVNVFQSYPHEIHHGDTNASCVDKPADNPASEPSGKPADKPASEPRRLRKRDILICTVVGVGLVAAIINYPVILAYASTFLENKIFTGDNAPAVDNAPAANNAPVNNTPANNQDKYYLSKGEIQILTTNVDDAGRRVGR